jgi:hypothetical protein
VQEALLFHLAGRITLDRFRILIHTLERSFSFYFPLLTSLLPRPQDGPASPLPPPQAAHDAYPGSRAVSGDLLAEALDRLQGIIPQRRRSKLTGPKLLDFMCRTGGGWFRLRDFQVHFAVDRKTAWEYVQKFLQAGLLVHNQAQAAAVRYGLADRYLKVKADAIRRKAAAALGGLPFPLAAQVADRLIASCGEPFWEEDWRGFLPPCHVQEIFQRLTGKASLLEAVWPGDGKNRLLRLQSIWLITPRETS